MEEVIDDAPEIWLHLEYDAVVWERFAAWHRPMLSSIPLFTLLFSSPVAIGMFFWPAMVAPDMLWLSLQLMTVVSVLLYIFQYAQYLRIRRAKSPSADIGPHGYRISPGSWVKLMREDYTYRMTIRTAHRERPTLLTLSRIARINPDSTDGWLRIEFPFSDDMSTTVEAFRMRFNDFSAAGERPEPERP